MNETRILGVVGSLRKDSYNRLALKAAQELLPAGALLSLFELHGIPVFDQDDEMALPASVLEFNLRQVLVTLNMPTVNQPEVMIGNAAQCFDEAGRLTDEPTRQCLQKLLSALVRLTRTSPTPKGRPVED
ncbi:MAG: arsenical resistance protein ArsH [Candidatus Accumulibacter phosphatis]|uniref:Arsenical resistance protein ArsH n=1 Tax=Candidatus Accumulibacter phosphatis TaxID=327160 RepID=A0A080LTB2_9PROT|nr:NAD(P)H-dependent oxidoreductase [Accumulibacter sp.]KFB71737.1 MAG: arsenical resistance protein ArsH [Candidatus Accumulibacter phosphatis]HRF12404.1 NAD(P)H-dependent oxidoreductase [Candidatus Accumulibacter phosphatis]